MVAKLQASESNQENVHTEYEGDPSCNMLRKKLLIKIRINKIKHSNQIDCLQFKCQMT